MTKKPYLKHTRAHPGLIVKKSKIDHKGIFTKFPIRKGETVMVFGGILIANNELDETKHRIFSVFPITDETFIGLPIEDNSESVDEYLNHSCNPNLWLTDEVTTVARRDIKAGEEITLDAATWDCDRTWLYSEDGNCYCGSENCRKKLTPDDWKLEDLQKSYNGHFSPYIEEKIKLLKISKRKNSFGINFSGNKFPDFIPFVKTFFGNNN